MDPAGVSGNDWQPRSFTRRSTGSGRSDSATRSRCVAAIWASSSSSVPPVPRRQITHLVAAKHQDQSRVDTKAIAQFLERVDSVTGAGSPDFKVIHFPVAPTGAAPGERLQCDPRHRQSMRRRRLGIGPGGFLPGAAGRYHDHPVEGECLDRGPPQGQVADVDRVEAAAENPGA